MGRGSPNGYSGPTVAELITLLDNWGAVHGYDGPTPAELTALLDFWADLHGDAFGRLRVSEQVLELDAKFTVDARPLEFNQIVSGGVGLPGVDDDPRVQLTGGSR